MHVGNHTGGKTHMTSILPEQMVGIRTVFEDTSETLGGFRTGYPKFYSMADLGTQSRRRWVPLEEAVSRTKPVSAELHDVGKIFFA